EEIGDDLRPRRHIRIIGKIRCPPRGEPHIIELYLVKPKLRGLHRDLYVILLHLRYRGVGPCTIRITILKPEGAFWCLYAPFRFCLGQVVIPETNYSSDNIDTVLMAFSQDLGRIIAADKKAQLSGHGRIGPVVDHSAFLDIYN